MPLPISDQ